jgi:hypothetical protein
MIMLLTAPCMTCKLFHDDVPVMRHLKGTRSLILTFWERLVPRRTVMALASLLRRLHEATLIRSSRLRQSGSACAGNRLKVAAGLFTLLCGKADKFPSSDLTPIGGLDVQARSARSFKEMHLMIRHLTTLILSGLVGSMVLVGDAEACHRTKCKCTTPMVCVATPVTCVKPARCVKVVSCVKPAPCAMPVATCAPKFKLCKISLPKFCHKRQVTTLACGTPVCYGTACPIGYPVASPQTSAQH